MLPFQRIQKQERNSTMRKYLYCEAGFIEKPNWLPHCWVNVECPTQEDFDFLQNTLKIPASFLHDIADTDERPRTDTEGNWLLTILRIPIQTPQDKVAYTTVPIGIITNNEIVVSVCYHSTEMIKQRSQLCGKRIGKKHPKRRLAPFDEPTEKPGLFQHLHPWK